MQPVIELRALTHHYGRKTALNNVSWQLRPGRVCGLLGRNGAGKTTTINILNSFLTPSSGDCLIFNEPAHNLPPAIKKRIGYLIEGHIQYGFLNFRQIERFYARFYENWNPAIYYKLMSKLDITPSQKISTMSCGQRSQVALGLILAQNPDLIIFDDYSMGLDPGYRRLFIEVIRDYAADGNRSILLTSHIIQDLETLIDDTLLYHRGELLIDMETSRLRREFHAYNFPTTPETRDHSEPKNKLAITRGENTSAIAGLIENEAAARDLLAARGIRPATLSPQNLTLEDIFISLTGKY
jgi:ABC-2 type transport system ATP-binding protein